jgi:hypothetical protein
MGGSSLWREAQPPASREDPAMKRTDTNDLLDLLDDEPIVPISATPGKIRHAGLTDEETARLDRLACHHL